MSNFSKIVLGWQVCQIQSTSYGHDGQTNPNHGNTAGISIDTLSDQVFIIM
jgi:hypothetical protein